MYHRVVLRTGYLHKGTCWANARECYLIAARRIMFSSLGFNNFSSGLRYIHVSQFAPKDSLTCIVHLLSLMDAFQCHVLDSSLNIRRR